MSRAVKKSPRIIAHLDMDAFFAAIEERDNERFRGLPIVVGADPMGGKGRGVVSTANYKAREYGIRSALPISKAWEYAEKARKEGKPAAIFVGGHMRRYGEVSRRIMEIVARYSEVYEQASVDEMYLDLSHLKTFVAAKKVCLEIKKEIMEKERLTCSIGLGPNKLIAKIASDFKKPDGLTMVTERDAEAFLEPMSIRKIPGVGPKTEERLNKEGIRTVKELKVFTREELSERFGKFGEALYRKARGESDSPVTEEYETKSVGEQETFEKDSRDAGFISEQMSVLCCEVFRRFSKEGFAKFRTVAITVRFADFETRSRAHTLAEDVGDVKTLEFEALKLLLPFFTARENPRKKAIRLIGVRVEKLSE